MKNEHRKKEIPERNVSLPAMAILALVFLILCQGCTVRHLSKCEKNGQVYCKAEGIFAEQWDDYYLIAMSCIEGECYDNALVALEEAIKQRPGDAYMAKTYGMNFMEYFPHREKGMICYIRGEYETAKKELGLSIKDAPTDKARYYLDKTREATLRELKIAKTLPKIELSVMSEKIDRAGEIWTKKDPVEVMFVAEDEQFVSEMTIGGQSIFVESADTRIVHTEKLLLSQGRHEIVATAANLLEGKKAKKIIVNVDRQGPQITLTKLDGNLGISGFLCDESGEIRLFANKKRIGIPKGREVEFAIPKKPATGEIVIEAVDMLGNRTVLKIGSNLLTENKDDSIRIAQVRPKILADSGYGSAWFLPSGGEPRIHLKGWSPRTEVFNEIVWVQFLLSPVFPSQFYQLSP